MHEPVIRGEDLVHDPSKDWYFWKNPETEKWYHVDPETLKVIAGRPRKELPVPKKYEKKIGREAWQRQFQKINKRRTKRYSRIEESIKQKEHVLAEKEKQLETIEEALTLKDKAPSIQDQRKMISALFLKHDFSPIEELISMAKGGKLTPRDRVSILKTLADFEAPKPKAVDLQVDQNLNIEIKRIDFSNTSQQLLKESLSGLPIGELIDMDEEDYKEFEEIDDPTSHLFKEIEA